MSSSPSVQSSTTTQDTRISTLINLMNSDFRDTLVAHVINSRNDLPDSVHESFNAIIRREVKVTGYPRRPERAPMHLLRPAIIRDLRESEALVRAVIGAWFNSQPSLRNLVEEHLTGRNISIDYPDFKARHLNGFWSTKDWISERDAIVQLHEDLDVDEVALMLCCVTGRMPTDMEGSSEDRNRTAKQSVLDQARTYLEKLPADSPEWGDVPAFLSSITDLSVVKEAEREAMASREAVETEIEKFLGEYSEQVVYLELDTSDWSMPIDGDQSVVSEALELLGQLRGLINEYDSIPYRGPTFAETASLFQEKETIIRRIQVVKSKLDGTLNSEDDPVKTSGTSNSCEEDADEEPEESERVEGNHAVTVQPQNQHMSSDATLSNLGVSGHSLDFDPTKFDYSIVLRSSTESVTVTPVPTHRQPRSK